MSDKYNNIRFDHVGESGRNRRRGKRKNMLMAVVRAILIILVLAAGTVAFLLSRSKPEEEKEYDFNQTFELDTGESREETLETLDDTNNKPVDELEGLDIEVFHDKDYVHYMLIGVDGRTKEISGRSDALMVLSINEKDRRLILSTIPRDTFVYINGKGYDKITHTHAYGGARLVVETVERNFDIDIQHYFTVNFTGIETVVDQVGGIPLEITQKESDHIASFFEVEGTHAGLNTLNGKQALAYARVRYIDSDFQRNVRQYNVLLAIYNKVKDMSVTQYPGLITSLYPYFYTDCTVAECIDIGNTIMDMGLGEIELARISDGSDGIIKSLNGHEVYILRDQEKTMMEWRDVLGVENYEPSANLTEISNYIKYNYVY